MKLEEHVFNLLPGYALECLDEEDLLKVARHLPHCALCRNELTTYLSAVDLLALSAPLRTPPSDLKAKILAHVEERSRPAADPQAAQPQVPPARSKATRAPVPATGPAVAHGFGDFFRGLFSHPVGLVLGALALLVVIFMSASNLLLWQRVNDLQARVPLGNIQVVNLAGTENAPQATGYLMVFKNETYGTLVVENAPQLKPGTTYQLWLIRDGKRINGGVFTVSTEGYGSLDVSANQPLETYPSFGITIEPAGGSPAPTGKKILGGKL